MAVKSSKPLSCASRFPYSTRLKVSLRKRYVSADGIGIPRQWALLTSPTEAILLT